MGKASRRKKAKSVTKIAAKREPGLDGTFSGTCVACLRPTDTALAAKGEPEWWAAFLVHLGLPEHEAIAMVDAYPPADLGPSPYPPDVFLVRVCERCTSKANFPKPVLAMEGQTVPVVAQIEADGIDPGWPLPQPEGRA